MSSAGGKEDVPGMAVRYPLRTSMQEQQLVLHLVVR